MQLGCIKKAWEKVGGGRRVVDSALFQRVVGDLSRVKSPNVVA